MRKMKRIIQTVVSTVAIAGVMVTNPVATNAMRPVIENDEGAFVRIVGNPSDGTVKFQYGWSTGSNASRDAVGYWVGVYDITRSTYVWVMATDDMGAMDFPDQFFRNARPTTELQDGEYKVNFFVRDSYGDPVTNVAEIELEFTVHHM